MVVDGAGQGHDCHSGLAILPAHRRVRLIGVINRPGEQAGATVGGEGRSPAQRPVVSGEPMPTSRWLDQPHHQHARTAAPTPNRGRLPPCRCARELMLPDFHRPPLGGPGLFWTRQCAPQRHSMRRFHLLFGLSCPTHPLRRPTGSGRFASIGDDCGEARSEVPGDGCGSQGWAASGALDGV